MDLESTFDVLYSQLARKWHQQDDIINPLHDRRCEYNSTVWTFDLDGDVLRFDKKNHNLLVSLGLIRQRSISISDFEPYEPPARPAHTLHPRQSRPHVTSNHDGWTIKRNGLCLQRLERHKEYICRILADFAFQWRHILSGRYNNFTYRRLACAIIRIVTLDFHVVEVTQSRQGRGGHLVWMQNLPVWDPFGGHIVRAGGASIVISQHIPHAIALIQEDFVNRNSSALRRGSSKVADRGLTYLILSVQEIILYRISNDFTRCTNPKRLFDNINPPSDEAIELLLEATQTSAPTALIHRLPVELQDMILDKVSAGPVDAARVGCILGAGSNFAWKSGGREIEREEAHRNRTPWSPVESNLMFGNTFSGICYK